MPLSMACSINGLVSFFAKIFLIRSPNYTVSWMCWSMSPNYSLNLSGIYGKLGIGFGNLADTFAIIIFSSALNLKITSKSLSSLN